MTLCRTNCNLLLFLLSKLDHYFWDNGVISQWYRRDKDLDSIKFLGFRELTFGSLVNCIYCVVKLMYWKLHFLIITP